MQFAMELRDRTTLRAYMHLMDLSERGLAARAGLAHATVNHLLSGRRDRCSASTAVAIERALAAPAGLFFHPAPNGRRRST